MVKEDHQKVHVNDFTKEFKRRQNLGYFTKKDRPERLCVNSEGIERSFSRNILSREAGEKCLNGLPR